MSSASRSSATLRGCRRRYRDRDLRGALADQLTVAAVGTLLVLGVLNMYAIGGVSLAVHQTVLAVVGLGLLVLFRRLPLERLTALGATCYVVAVLTLGAVALIGTETHGARRWLSLGPVTFQPSELAKLGLVLVLAGVLGGTLPAWRRFGYAVGAAGVPIGLTLYEPDLSTATTLVVVSATLLVLGRVPARFLLPLFGGAVVVAPLAIRLLHGYQVERLRAFVVGTHAASGPGWASLQAHIALALGGLTGQFHHPLHGLYAAYLPERETDLALASLVEQWGAPAGALAVLAVAVLVWRMVLAGRAAPTRRGTLVGAGFATLLGVETVLSLGGNLGLLPIAGVPFPLLSYGGTAVVVHLLGIGIVLGIRRHGVRRPLWHPPRTGHPRPRLARFTAFGITCVLGLFSWYGAALQAGDGPRLRAAGMSEMTRCVTVPAPRGDITDRHGTPLATSTRRADVVAFPALVARHPRTVSRLAGLVGRPVRAVQQRLAHAHGLTGVVATVSAARARRIAAAEPAGVWLSVRDERHHPRSGGLGSVLGFAGVATSVEEKRYPQVGPGEIVGRSGLEASYDALLRGVPGRECAYVDPAGHPVAPASRTDPVPGADLRTSLDLGLQRNLMADLRHHVRARGGGQGGAVAMNPRTGQLLAVASLPNHDPGVYGPPVHPRAVRALAHRSGSPTLQHATQVAAPPGSTFKLVIACADLRYGTVPAHRVIRTGGSYRLGGHTFHNWTTLGPSDLSQAITHSNDVYFYKLAVALGPNRIAHVARRLGVGEPTGVDLPEAPGYLGTPASVRAAGGHWYQGSTVVMGIGQGDVTATPLQNARWTAAVTTGHVPTPRVGLASETQGTTTRLPTPHSRRLPCASHLGPIRTGMRGAVTSGTATFARGLPMNVGAKTGSAQNPGAGGTDSWFTAAAPVDHPRVVMAAYVRRGGEGAKTAGPVVASGLRYYAAHVKRITATG